METKYHLEITKLALQPHFSETALQIITQANIRQDRLAYMVGHDYIHFDGSAFAEGFDYLQNQQSQIFESISKRDFQSSQKAFGRMTHSWQDFYSHSNYVQLWVNKSGEYNPHKIIPADDDIINHPSLQSGKNYGLVEFLAMLPILSPFLLSKMPADSHAKMNLDSTKSGEYFLFAYHAALKQTTKIFHEISQKITQLPNGSEMIKGFIGE